MTQRKDYPASKAEAKSLGLRFYAGLACSAHPKALRYTCNGHCAECCKAERRERAPAYQAKDAARKKAARERAKALPPVTPQAFADLLG